MTEGRLEGDTAVIRIVVKPVRNGQKWQAFFEDEQLCIASAPLIMSARLLVANGFNPARLIEMWHQNASSPALYGQLGRVAYTLLDGEKKPRLIKYGVSPRFLVAEKFLK